MKILTYSLGQLQTNCYFLINGKDCLIIDPADEAAFILEELQRRDLSLVGLLATHGHFDHIGAVGEIQESFNVSLNIFKKDQFLIDRLNQTATQFLGFSPHFIKPKYVKYLTERKFQILNFKFQIFHCSGHTPGGGCFYFTDNQCVFTGDTLFKQGIGRYDFSYCNKKDLLNSVKKILRLPKNTVIYPGHGEKTTVDAEENILTTIY